MRSSQLNFFLTQNDQAELLAELDLLGSFVYIESTSESGALRILGSAEIKKMGSEPLKIGVTLSRYVDKIDLIRSGVRAFADIDASPLIEFGRCYQDEECIRRGRFYFVKRFVAARGVVNKDEEFVKWGNSLISRARRVLKRDSVSSAYFGSEALRLVSEGIKPAVG